MADIHFFLTTLPTNTSSQIERVHAFYSKRWKIETNGNRELKHSWYLNRFPGERWDAVNAHISFTLFMFNVVGAFRSKKGKSLTERGVISLRNKYFKGFFKEHEIVIEADGFVGTFSFLEFLAALNLPPTGRLQEYPKLIVYPNGKKELWL